MIWKINLINIDVIYLILKLNGLIPLNFTSKRLTPTKAITSTSSLIYCTTFCVAIFFLLPIAQIFILCHINLMHHGKFINFLVFLFEIILRTFRCISLYIIQLINRMKFAHLINDGYRLYTAWTNLYPNDTFFDQNYFLYLVVKFFANICQLFIVCCSFFGYFNAKHYPSMIVHIFTFFLIQYSNYILTIITFMYFWHMLIVAQFYRNFNRKIELLLKQLNGMVKLNNDANKYQMKMQIFCNMSDEIDRIIILYEWTTNYTKMIVNCYSIQLILLLLDSFVSVLSQVWMKIF